ncbi:MAG: MarR family transcriptional regulator [Candidatus Dormiibacterota bacterium]
MARNPRPGPEQLAAWRALLMVSRGLRVRLERELAQERRLSLPWYEVLLRLWEAPEHRLRMHDLAVGTQLSRNGLSQLVGRMEAAGYVDRVASDDDGRGTFAVLQPAGKRAFQRAARIHLRGIEEHFGSRFTPDQARQLASLLELVIHECPDAEPQCDGEPSEQLETGTDCIE